MERKMGTTIIIVSGLGLKGLGVLGESELQ